MDEFNSIDEVECWICSVCLYHCAELGDSQTHQNRYNTEFQCDGHLFSHSDFDRQLESVIVKRWCEDGIAAIDNKLRELSEVKKTEFTAADGAIWTTKKILGYRKKIVYKLNQANIDIVKYAQKGLTTSVAEMEFELRNWLDSDVVRHAPIDPTPYTLGELLPARQEVLDRPVICNACGFTTHIEHSDEPRIAMHQRGDNSEYACWNSLRRLTFSDLIAVNTGWGKLVGSDVTYRIKDGLVMSDEGWLMYGENGFDEWDRSDPNNA